MNISKETLSYIIGFLHADGHLYETTRNRGRLSIELAYRDKEILFKINSIFKNRGNIRDRIRDTNYKKNYKSSILTFCSKDIRDFLKSYGLIAGRKGNKTYIPKNVNTKDYIKGYLDGNGSMGYTAADFPFLSISTPSKILKESVCDFIFKVTRKRKEINPNERDNFYNIVVYKEDAQRIASYLYDKSQIHIDRKYKSYLDIMRWERPEDMIISNKKSWTTKEDLFITVHSLDESVKELKRSKSSIKTRKWRLKCLQ